MKFNQLKAHLGIGKDEIHRSYVEKTLFVQYYSMICRPSEHTVGTPWAENQTRDGRSRGKDSNH